MRALLVNKPGRDFAALVAATGAANLADATFLLALPLLALGLSASPGQVAVITVLLTAAWPVFGLPAGLIADRLDRRRLVMVVNAARAVILLALALLVVAGKLAMVWIWVAAFLLGIGETLVDSSLAALIPATVRDPATLGRANARMEFAMNATNQFLGPPLAGLVAAAGLVWVTGMGALLFLATVPLLAALSPATRTARAAPAGSASSVGVADLFAGLRLIAADRLLRSLTLMTAAMNVFWAAWLAVLVVYLVAPGPGGLTPAGYGLLLSAMALGGLVGAAVVERLRRWWGDWWVLALDVLGTVLLIGTPGLTTQPVLLGMAMFVGGAGSVVWRVLVSVIRQRHAPPELQARVYSASRVISWGVLPVGAGLGGLVAQFAGVRAVFVLGGAASLGLLLLYVRLVRPVDLSRAGPVTVVAGSA
jgi:MFS family permease